MCVCLCLCSWRRTLQRCTVWLWRRISLWGTWNQLWSKSTITTRQVRTSSTSCSPRPSRIWWISFLHCEVIFLWSNSGDLGPDFLQRFSLDSPLGPTPQQILLSSQERGEITCFVSSTSTLNSSLDNLVGVFFVWGSDISILRCLSSFCLFLFASVASSPGPGWILWRISCCSLTYTPLDFLQASQFALSRHSLSHSVLMNGFLCICRWWGSYWLHIPLCRE